MASHTLNRIFRTQVSSAVLPRELRSRLFVAAASSSLTRKELCERVAGEFGIHPDDLETSIYADLPSQRCIVPPNQELPPRELALRTNLMLIQGLLARTRLVELELAGNSAGVVRHAKRKGLICVTKAGVENGGVHLSLSGPYSLFRSTLLYGRALGDLVPVLAWCNEFRMSAEVISGGDPSSWRSERVIPSFQAIRPNHLIANSRSAFVAVSSVLPPRGTLSASPSPSSRWNNYLSGFCRAASSGSDATMVA